MELMQMLVLDGLTEKDYSPMQWVRYYKNVWTRQLVALTIDVEGDRIIKKKDPDRMVLDTRTSKMISIKERLENRKIILEEALDIIAGIDNIISIDKSTAESFQDKYWSSDALKIDEDMLISEPKIGDPCKLENGVEGILTDSENGLICSEREEPTQEK